MPLVSGQVVHGRYRVISLLSQGGMGAVYEVMDTVLNVRYALKEMTPYPGSPGTALPQLREQFLQEAQLLAVLRHPNLPRVTNHFEEDGNAYLVMDFVHGKRLDEIISQRGGLPEEQVLEWARQLMGALAHCHENDVIHRDVKPHNVVITPQGQVVLVDFGLAKLIDPDDPRTRTVMRGLGTPEYAPPEQYDAEKGYTDARTDVYALGATLYHALVGKAPPTVTERIVNPKSLLPLRQLRGDVSRASERVIMKALALRPSRRFESIGEMYKALFKSPPSWMEKTGFLHLGDIPDLVAEVSGTTVLLPWIDVARRRIDRRVGIALLVASLVFVAMFAVLMTDRIGAVGVSTGTETSTPTTLVSPTSTSTPTPTPTASSTPVPTVPTIHWPRRTPALEFFGPPSSQSPTPSPSPTPTRIFVPPTDTPTMTIMPTDTPRPAGGSSSRRPTATPTNIPTDTPKPTPSPTTEPSPTATEIFRPTLPPQGGE